MFQIHDIRESRIYKEALQEGFEQGFEKGFEKGWVQVVKLAIPPLSSIGMTAEEIAATFAMDVDEVSKHITQSQEREVETADQLFVVVGSTSSPP